MLLLVEPKQNCVPPDCGSQQGPHNISEGDAFTLLVLLFLSLDPIRPNVVVGFSETNVQAQFTVLEAGQHAQRWHGVSHMRKCAASMRTVRFFGSVRSTRNSAGAVQFILVPSRKAAAAKK
jgi:hypothetical protein